MFRLLPGICDIVLLKKVLAKVIAGGASAALGGKKKRGRS
jgi:hypothetical protein